jgi:hypothetical protein
MRRVAWIWNGLRIVHASMGLKREAITLFILLLPLLFHARVSSFLAAHGIPDWPVVDGTMPAVIVAGTYLYWRLLRHSIIREYVARPNLAVRILDPGQRYDTLVALGNRVLRLYHVEVENRSMFRTARGVAVTLLDYQKAGDSRAVEIRARLKIANSEAEELDLNPGARVAFELCGVEVSGAEPAAAEPREWQTFSILPPGSGTLRLFAEARDAPARQETYMLYVDTTGTMTIRPQAGAEAA